MTALAAAQGLLQRLLEAMPVAWRHDPVFRGAAIGAGVTLALFLLRVVGPHDPQLASTPPALREFMPRPGAAPSPARPPLAEVPKIAPGRPLSDVTVVPTPDGDRFGTFTPARKP